MLICMYKEREQVIKACRDLFGMGLNLGTWGNISRISREKQTIIITPSGVDYNTLQSTDLVAIDMEGSVTEGVLKPSTESALHLAIYHAREDVGAIAHTHSVFATAAAVTRTAIPAVVEDMAQIIGGDVQVAEYAMPGTPELAKNTVSALGSRNAVLLANHGVVGVGKNMEEAVLACQVVEKSAQVLAYSKFFGSPVYLSKEDIDEMHHFYVNKYKQNK